MARDSYSNDHTIKIVGDTQTLTVDQNLEVLGDLTVGGEIDADYSNLDISGNLTVAGNVDVEGSITAGSFSFDNNIQVMKVIPNYQLESLIGLGDANVSSAISYLAADTISSNPDTQHIAFFTGGSGFIKIPLDPYLIHFGSVHSLGLWMMSSASGSTADVTVEIQSLNVTGSSTSWFSVASDTQSVSTSLSRTAFEFDLGDSLVDLASNTYQLVISTTGELDSLGLWRIGVLIKENTIPALLGKFP